MGPRRTDPEENLTASPSLPGRDGGHTLRKTILDLYSSCPLLDRIHVHLRIQCLPLEEIDRHIPREGSILDVGCGHGVVANYLALRSTRRTVTGIDIDESKIECAVTTAKRRENIGFTTARIRDLHAEKYDAIIVSDVLYLLDREAQRRILEETSARLEENGLCLIKTVDFSSPMTKLLAHFHERVMKDLFRLTRGGGSLLFHDLDGWTELLVEADFSFEMRSIPSTGHLFAKPTWLFLCHSRR